MNEQEPRKGGGGGGKLSRSETVTVRLDPKLRYLAELAARVHRRTLSSYAEWAIEASLANSSLGLASGGRSPSIKDDAERLWDVDEADRFVKLALRYPHLLSHTEQVRWKLIRECDYFWYVKISPPPSRQRSWVISEETLIYNRLRDSWDVVCAVANGEQPASSLPKAAPPAPPPKDSSADFDGIDEDISF